jgi:hypothetical protein
MDSAIHAFEPAETGSDDREKTKNRTFRGNTVGSL